MERAPSLATVSDDDLLRRLSDLLAQCRRDEADLILALRDSLGATVVAVTHELPSIFAIGNNSIFLDAETKTAIAGGDPKELLVHTENPKVREFLTRGEGRPGE